MYFLFLPQSQNDWEGKSFDSDHLGSCDIATRDSGKGTLRIVSESSARISV